jgi:arginyl-tRNA synthetase
MIEESTFANLCSLGKIRKRRNSETTGLKGDKLGNYVEFDKNYKAQISELKEQGLDEETAKKQAPIIQEAQKMLLDWEQNKPEVRELWEK